MDNKQSPALHYIKTILRSDFKVGEYPFDVDKYALGDWNAVALVQDGDELLYEPQQNKAVNKEWNITIWLYSNNKKQTIDYVLGLQKDIEDLILDDVSLDSTVRCINIISIEKGDELSVFDGHTVGYHGNKTCRKLNFVAKIDQVR
jgi:hypothetical protein